MTLLEVQEILRNTIRATAKSHFSVDLDLIVSETPPKSELGDVAFPVAFDLAKRIKQATGEKRNPREIAETLSLELGSLNFVDRVDIAGAGYVNVFLDRARFVRGNAAAEPLPALKIATTADAIKVCVEHTSVNPNKAAHIGHVRNAVLGDTFQRILTATGKQVEIQFYIDNTGVQVADVAIGFIYLNNMDLAAINELHQKLLSEGKTFDYYCWDLYARVGQEYLKDEALKEKRAEVLHAVEAGGNDIAEIAEYIASANVKCIVDTMNRFSIRYDLLPRESDILHLHFWNKAFEQMKELGVIRYETEGKQAGCWVMPFEEHSGDGDNENDKILVRSNGTVTYTGKDIAYQMWKLGILGLDFYYKPFYEYTDGRVVWTTTDNADEDIESRPELGGGETIYNVIDSRQSYPQQIVRQGVAAISPERGEQASVHLSYEMVALSPAAAAELGFVISDEDKKRPFVEMSGRKGLGVKADDLINRLEANALLEVGSRHAEAEDDEKRLIAHQLAVGALRYFLSKFTRNTVIVFDFKEALSFEGETGCFCQYSAVRANSIFRKLAESDSVEACRSRIENNEGVAELFASDLGTDIWSTIVLASRLEETIDVAEAANEPAILAKYTFTLAKAFNLFYHNHKIIAEPNDTKRALLIVVADMARRALTAALDTLGIEVPEKM